MTKGKGTEDFQSGFEGAYSALNVAQKKAVDALDGPVMVIAGPGTGKTQVLALRIANILTKTDTPPHGILCLTFTRAGVKAMRERLATYIGARAREVVVSTFHSFAIDLLEKHYALLDFDDAPALLDDQHAVALIDELLESGSWQYIRPRGDVAKYFADLRSLVSLMKRERLTPEKFLSEIEKEITALKESPESLSSRGETKGQIKKEVQKKIEGLERTREVIVFYELYEKEKRARLLMDYDDALEYAVKLVQDFEDVRADVRENYLYTLIDEHQDSSGVQNAFLEAVWQGVEAPNIFVVGDDRQLIYGFGGASLSYFEEFKITFGTVELITLTDNYRSTTPILSLADELLKSTLTTETLQSHKKGNEKVSLNEYTYARDEVIAAGVHFKQMINTGIPAEECALLVPKNRHIRSAVETLRGMGLPIKSKSSVSLFSLRETESLRNVLRVVADPYDAIALSRTLFDPLTGISPLVAHAFLKRTDTRTLSIQTLVDHSSSGGLFDAQDPIVAWGTKLSRWVDESVHVGVEPLIHLVGNEYLIDEAHDHDTLTRQIELVRTMIHLAEARADEHPQETLVEFLRYLDRLETYGHTIPVATLLGGKGISVLTLHGSKGLEFDDVWIAHLNESVLMAQKRMGFAVPETIEHMIEERDRTVATREVYVAITRAKEHCTISYSRSTTSESELELAHLVADLPQSHFIKKSAEETEAELVAVDPKLYVAKQITAVESSDTEKLIETVREEYTDRKVSVTLLNNFFECPWKWYFRNLLQLPEIKSEYQLFGSAVHDALEKILKDELATNENEIRSSISEYLEKGGVREASALTRLGKEGTEAVLRWASHYLSDIATDHTAERSLSYKDPEYMHLTMYGKVDLTERFSDGTIAVTDFKTGSAKTTGVIEKRDDDGRLSSHLRQLAMYSYLIRGSEKKDVTESKLLYIEEDPKEKNALYRTHISDEEIDLLRRDITDYDELIKSGKWMDLRCCFKPFGKETECEYCKWAREVYGKDNSK